MVRTRVALLHLNPQLGKLKENIETLSLLVEEALGHGAKLVITPELSLSGFSITEEEVQGGLGLAAPFTELAKIEALARTHRATIVVGLARLESGARPRNSALVFGPDGLIGMQDKRALSGFHDRGNTPVKVFETPHGDLAPVLCSDTYLPDVTRIAALGGADIIALPANWWGNFGQASLWRARARENGVWIVVSNRWGTEVDTRGGATCSDEKPCSFSQCFSGKCGYRYEMADAPSALISPTGEVQLLYRTGDDGLARTRILYGTIEIDRARIGSKNNETETVRGRRPEAYGALSNEWWKTRSEAPPNLPPPGKVLGGVLVPRAGCTERCVLDLLIAERNAGVKLWALPALAFSPAPVDLTRDVWATTAPWSEVQAAVDAASVEALATTVLDANHHEQLVLFRRGQPALAHPPLHQKTSTGPWIVDLPNVRLAIVSGKDLLFPETAVVLAKSSVDVVLVSSRSVGASYDEVSGPWKSEDVFAAWFAASNAGLSILAADAAGYGVVENDGGGFLHSQKVIDPASALRTATETLMPGRIHGLNVYYPFDLEALLETPRGAN